MNCKFMLDTNIFDKLLENKTLIDNLSKEHKYYHITHIQHEEILNISEDKKDKKKLLLEIYEKIKDNMIVTTSAIYGVSTYGGASYTSKENLIDELSLTSPKHLEDAIIAETAIENNMIFVTEDKRLIAKVNKLGYKAIDFEDFTKEEININNG
jgi:predicted nucleic acid-binding protein